MKKSFHIFFITCLFTALLSMTAYANASIDKSDVTIDKANIANGIVVVKLTEVKGKIIALVEKGSDKYTYVLTQKTSNIPLQMGTGDYKITVAVAMGDKYMPLASEGISAAAINENEMYKASIPLIEYSISTKAVPSYKALAGEKAANDMASTIYDDIVNNYSYDFDKVTEIAAKGLKESDYIPALDETYNTKKGICYDFASLLGGTLRSLGIPTKLVKGYVPDISEYHAWNEILMDGKWIAVDSTYDVAVVKAGLDYTMEKDKAKTKVVRTY